MESFIRGFTVLYNCDAYFFFLQRSARQANRACTISCHSRGIDARLRIRVRDAWDLEDRDGFLAGKSDPYVQITAVRDATLFESRIRPAPRMESLMQPGMKSWISAAADGSILT